MNRRGAWALACCGLLAGCAGPSQPQLAGVYAKSLEAERRGLKAEAAGNPEQALRHYRQALKLHRSVEDSDGIATDLVNLAILCQRLGQEEQARAWIEEALSLPEVGDAIRAEAAYENAKLHLKNQQLAKAREWAGKSLALAPNRRVESRFNLLGRIAFLETQDEEALRWANAALEANRDEPRLAEQANSLRLIADVEARQGHDAVAKARYLEALKVDKEAGESAKIALDLTALGKLSLKTGNREEAERFFQRAGQVNRNAAP